jgi:hypothetical protein
VIIEQATFPNPYQNIFFASTASNKPSIASRQLLAASRQLPVTSRQPPVAFQSLHENIFPEF